VYSGISKLTRHVALGAGGGRDLVRLEVVYQLHEVTESERSPVMEKEADTVDMGSL